MSPVSTRFVPLTPHTNLICTGPKNYKQNLAGLEQSCTIIYFCLRSSSSMWVQIYTCVQCGHNASLTTSGGGLTNRISIRPQLHLYIHVVKHYLIAIRLPEAHFKHRCKKPQRNDNKIRNYYFCVTLAMKAPLCDDPGSIGLDPCTAFQVVTKHK